MQRLETNEPLLFSHIPKTAGSSMARVFQTWFGDNICFYRPGLSEPGRCQLPESLDPSHGVVIYGHFNRARGYGLEHAIPGRKQIMTMVRDPWERVLSGYFYRCDRADKNPAFRKVAAMSLEEYLAGWPYDDPDFGPPMSNFLPEVRSAEDVAPALDACCVAVGVTEQAKTSMRLFAQILGMPPVSNMPHVNAVPRNHEIPLHLKPAFLDRAEIDVAIYDWGRTRFEQATTGF